MPSKRTRLISLDEQTEAILANSENASALVRRLLVAHDQGEHLVSAHRDALKLRVQHLERVLLSIYKATTHPDLAVYRLRRVQEIVLDEIDLPEYMIRKEA